MRSPLKRKRAKDASKPHTAGQRIAIVTGLGLDADDPSAHAFAISEGLIRTDPPFVPSPWPRHPPAA